MSPPAGAGRVFLAALVVALASACQPAATPPDPDLPFLGPEEETTLAIELATGEAVRLEVEQRGVDLELIPEPPGGEPLPAVDSFLPQAAVGLEMVHLVADRAGEYRVRLRAFPNQSGGHYRWRWSEPRRATAADRGLEGAERALASAEGHRQAGDWPAACAAYRASLAALTDLGSRGADGSLDTRRLEILGQEGEFAERSLATAPDLRDLLGDAFSPTTPLAVVRAMVHREAYTRRYLGECAWQADDPEEALGQLARAGDLFAAIGSLWEQATAENERAEVLRLSGRLAEAARLHRANLPRRMAAGNALGEAKSRNNFALVLSYLGEAQAAEEQLRGALEIFERLDRKDEILNVLNNLGGVLVTRGDESGARRTFERILSLGPKPALEGRVRNQLGQLAARRGEPERAEELHRQALELRRAAKDRRGEAATLQDLADLAFEAGRRDDARRFFDQALALPEASQDPGNRALLWSQLGDLALEEERWSAAEEYFDRALAQLDRTGHRRGRAEAHAGRARALRRRDLVAAREAALAAVESFRAVRLQGLDAQGRRDLHRRGLRAYDFAIDLLMELDRTQPGAGHGERAFELRGDARGLSLLEGFLSDRLAARQALSIEDRQHLEEVEGKVREIEQEINDGLWQERPTLGGDQSSLALLQAAQGDLERELRELERRLLGDREEDLVAKLRQERSRLADLRLLLPDAQTLLASLSLGEARSFLWLVSRDRFESFELPPRSAIEALVRTAHGEIQEQRYRAPGTVTTPALGELSALLLGEAAGRHGDWLAGFDHWLVIPDGLAHYVPWGALSWPSGPGERREPPRGERPTPETPRPEPLVRRLALTTFPSAPAWQRLQQSTPRESATGRPLAVFGDPVLSPRHPALGSTERDPFADHFPRLHYAHQEARQIAAMAGGTAFLGFDASLERLLGLALEDYRVLHFSTHGVLHRDPDRHGLWLSRYDRRGQPVGGLLNDREIRRLRLAADLVVLSGCETALGAESPVEGFLGMTQAFFQAGAARLVVSLWAVDDASTSKLMQELHHAYWQQDRPAGEALRTAQLALLEHPKWNAPFYWAGFVQQGRLD